MTTRVLGRATSNLVALGLLLFCSAVLAMGGSRIAHASCSGGWPVFRGDIPDFFLPEGHPTPKDAWVEFEVFDNVPGQYCTVTGRATIPGVSIRAPYNNNEWVSYPNHASLGPHAAPGFRKGFWLSVKVEPWVTPQWAAIELFAMTGEGSSFTKLRTISLRIGPQHPTVFTQRADTNSLVAGRVRLDHPLLDGNPGAVISAGLAWAGVRNPHPFGVRYDEAQGHWHLENTNGTSIPSGTAFTVKVDRFAATVHEATEANSYYGYITRVDDPAANRNPRATLIVTQNNNGRANPHNIAVWYDPWAERWTIFNQDGANIVGSRFNVKVLGFAEGSVLTIGGSSEHNWSNISPWTDPGRLLLATPNSTTGAVYDHPIGTWWTGDNWAVYNDDVAPMSPGAAFNVWTIFSEI
jgi:hypothetical protein